MQFDKVVLPEMIETGDVSAYAKELDLLAESVFKSGESGFDLTLNNQISRELSVAINESIDLNGGLQEAEFREEVIEKMRKVMKEIPVVNFKVAVIPSSQTIKKIHEWATANLHDPVVLEFEADPEIMGGAIISHGGKYTDKSIVAKWPGIWKEATEQLWAAGKPKSGEGI